MDDDVVLETRTKQFACGDSYRGSWNASGLPDGEGRYTWRDGSTYEGGWKDGQLHGVGRYTWADGATYRGEWREGCMHGIGVWESADGRRRYQGGWHANAPHGLGRMAFAHGDVYEGLWSLGLPSGPGRYVYGSGGGGAAGVADSGGGDAAAHVTNGGGGDGCAEYDGEWLAGRMHGHGTCVWASGERYDGTWRDGRMHGVGLLVGADGSLYDGCWRRGRKHGVGVLRPGRTAVPPVAAVTGTFPASPAAGTARGAFDRALQRLRFSNAASGTSGMAEGEAGAGDAAIPFPSAPASPAPGGSPRGAASPRASPRGFPGPGGVANRADSPQKSAGGLGGGDGSGGSRGSTATGMVNGSGAGVDGLRLRLRLLAEGGGSSGGAGGDDGSGSAPQSPVVRWVRQCTDSDAEEGGEGGRQGQGRRQGQGVQQEAEELLSTSTTDPDSLTTTPKATPHRSRPPQIQLPNASAILTAENGGSPGSPGPGPFSHGGSGPLSPGSGGGRPCFHVRCYARGVPLRETLLPAELVETALPLHLRPGAAAKRQRERPLLRLVRPGPAAGPRRPRPRLGDPVSPSHSRYALVVALQLGIRFSVGRVSHEPLPRHPSSDEFTMQVTQEFARCGSEVTPVHPVQDFVWEDFAPMVFRRLRDLCGVDAGAYLRSLCCGSSLRHLASPGKSGSAFFVSQDERFFIKSMSRSEQRLLLSALPAYLDHLAAHPHSLLCRFMGLHAITAPGGKKYLFVVMSNVFRSDHQQLLPLHRRYDLKGSTLGRTAGPAARSSSAPQVSLGTPGPDASTRAGDSASHHSAGASLYTQPWSPESEFDPDVILKDLDLDVEFRLGDGWRDRLLSQLRADTAVLSSLGVMDYSLLVGVHFRRAGADAAAAGGEGAGGGGAGGTAGGSPSGNRGGSAQQELSQVAERISKLRLPPRLGLGGQGGEDGGSGGGGGGSGAGGDSGSGGRAEALKRDLLEFARDRILGTPEGAGSSAAAPLGDTAIWRTADSAPHPGPGPGTRPAAPPSAPGAAAAAAPGPSLNDALALSLGQGSVTLGVAMAGVAVRREHKQLKQQRSTTPFRGRSASPSPPPRRAETTRSELSTEQLRPATDDHSERGADTGLQGQAQGQGQEVEVVLWFALIDILQPFTPAKRLEAGFKGLLHAPAAVSVAAPQAYAARFQAFMREVFCE